MAQASYVPKAIRAHITGASPESSTKPTRTANQPRLSASLSAPLSPVTAEIAAGPIGIDRVDARLLSLALEAGRALPPAAWRSKRRVA
jgi:hypothetical protein